MKGVTLKRASSCYTITQLYHSCVVLLKCTAAVILPESYLRSLPVYWICSISQQQVLLDAGLCLLLLLPSRHPQYSLFNPSTPRAVIHSRELNSNINIINNGRASQPKSIPAR